MADQPFTVLWLCDRKKPCRFKGFCGDPCKRTSDPAHALNGARKPTAPAFELHIQGNGALVFIENETP